ncbi:Uridylate kinase/adenylate kinase [Handroanthus impetiginosus]|uniref:adenylate kinase n=1 Tax=Handroanthus impetiginosus TaxID=429701 RepID=A0A2G9G4V2_9LAMI|nr:Uridylate kinase/adenylate kinase [Handroanthus impetiginosus]
MGTVVDAASKEANGSSQTNKNIKVVFVLGGPGSCKSTQCAKIALHFGYTHLGTGDLLRAEIKSDSENGAMIWYKIKEEEIVPLELTINITIDGFPHNEESHAAFDFVIGMAKFVLFFDCSKEEREKRLLNRNQIYDNIETIRKRFKVYKESSLPVLEYYNSKGKVRKIDAAKPIEEVFEEVKKVFTSRSDKP